MRDDDYFITLIAFALHDAAQSVDIGLKILDGRSLLDGRECDCVGDVVR